mmetsp:Transcript_14501/g.29191  ORF Transcript_14501/g.29191 Transcript_14501/m.29191 type:complete len:267 (+) Transcript_14501:194-994(+)
MRHIMRAIVGRITAPLYVPITYAASSYLTSLPSRHALIRLSLPACLSPATRREHAVSASHNCRYLVRWKQFSTHGCACIVGPPSTSFFSTLEFLFYVFFIHSFIDSFIYFVELNFFPPSCANTTINRGASPIYSLILEQKRDDSKGNQFAVILVELPVLSLTPQLIPEGAVEEENREKNHIEPGDEEGDLDRGHPEERGENLRHIVKVSCDAPPARAEEQRGSFLPLLCLVCCPDELRGLSPDVVLSPRFSEVLFLLVAVIVHPDH